MYRGMSDWIKENKGNEERSKGHKEEKKEGKKERKEPLISKCKPQTKQSPIINPKFSLKEDQSQFIVFLLIRINYTRLLQIKLTRSIKSSPDKLKPTYGPEPSWLLSFQVQILVLSIMISNLSGKGSVSFIRFIFHAQ